jgi:hypothetical protein
MSSPLDLRALMSALEHAPDLDLLQLRVAIDHLLHNPKRILAIRARLRTGQLVRFWSVHDRSMRQGRTVQFKPEQVLIHEDGQTTNYQVWTEYAAIKLDDAAPVPELKPRPMLTREDFHRGESVSFEGRDLIEHAGNITRLNTKTATVTCPEGEWRVPYALLRRVLDV